MVVTLLGMTMLVRWVHSSGGVFVNACGYDGSLTVQPGEEWGPDDTTESLVNMLNEDAPVGS